MTVELYWLYSHQNKSNDNQKFKKANDYSEIDNDDATDHKLQLIR